MITQPIQIHLASTRAIYFLTLLFAFMLPLPFTNGQTGLISMFLLLFWLVEGSLKGKLHQLLRNYAFMAFVAFMAYNYLSLLWSSHSSTGLITLKYFKYFWILLPVIITSFCKEKLAHILYAYIAGLVLTSLISYVAYFDIIHITAFDDNVNTISLLPYSVLTPFLAFGALFFINKFSYSAYTFKSKLLFLFIALFFSFLLIVNDGRAGQLAFFITLLFLTWKAFDKKIFVQFILLFMLAVSAFFIVQNQHYLPKRVSCGVEEISNFRENNHVGGSWGPRAAAWFIGYNVFRENTLFGTGVGDNVDAGYRIIERDYPDLIPFQWIGHYHSQYLAFATKLGLSGLALLALFLYHFMSQPIADGETRRLRLLFVILLLVNSIGDSILYFKPYNSFIALFIAYFIASSGYTPKPDKHKKTTKNS